jgi:hypothetical protein
MACRINSCENDAVFKGFCNSCYAKVLKLFEQRQSNLDVDFQPSATANSSASKSAVAIARPISSGEKEGRQPASEALSAQYSGSRDRLDAIRERERQEKEKEKEAHNRDRLDAIREQRMQVESLSPRRLSRSTDTLNGASPINQKTDSGISLHRVGVLSLFVISFSVFVYSDFLAHSQAARR